MSTIEDLALSAAKDLIVGGAFDGEIEAIIVSTLRKRDTGLNELGFVLKMAVEMMDRSAPALSFSEAKRLAGIAYMEFRRDSRVKFGDPAYAWDGPAARIVAHEYSIDYWEQAA